MNDTIKSGETENVVNMLLNNSFGNHLMSMAHSRQSSLQGTLTNFEFGEPGTYNVSDIPEDLSENVQIDEQFL